MELLTTKRVIAVHREVIRTHGEDPRIVSEGNLHQLVFLANLDEDIFSRVAGICFFLYTYPIFRVGNRRTAQQLALALLADEGRSLTPGSDLPGLLAGISSYTLEPEDIARWIREHSQRTLNKGSRNLPLTE